MLMILILLFTKTQGILKKIMSRIMIKSRRENRGYRDAVLVGAVRSTSASYFAARSFTFAR